MRSDGLYGMERTGCFFSNYNIDVIVKGESLTNSDPGYVQFVYTFDAHYYIRIGELSCSMWVIKIISSDFALFSFKLFAEAQYEMCCNSFGIVEALICAGH